MQCIGMNSYIPMRSSPFSLYYLYDVCRTKMLVPRVVSHLIPQHESIGSREGQKLEVRQQRNVIDPVGVLLEPNLVL